MSIWLRKGINVFYAFCDYHSNIILFFLSFLNFQLFLITANRVLYLNNHLVDIYHLVNPIQDFYHDIFPRRLALFAFCMLMQIELTS